ncbi:MAG: type II toxin-antitoxin system mRNA interferase toxin, RelE/StbE family [Ignavibacteria bacterium]|nr:type II toxin-antitoxin system mRNA interferase toxin, RelE/StbE family [Ignavibacteria bacterium]
MPTLHWSSRYQSAFRKRTKQNPKLYDKIADIMRRLEQDPFAGTLKTHKLHGRFEGSWACSVEYDLRIVFEFKKNPDTQQDDILLVDIGTHDEVY